MSAIDNLECYPPELLSCIPLTLRYQLLSHCPIVDVCRLEKTSVFDDIDSEKLWGLLCDNIWKSARFEEYYESYLNHDMCAENQFNEMSTTNVPSREKCFVLLTTAILCAERPSGLFCEEKGYTYTLDTLPQEWLKSCCPADVVNFLVCSHDFSQQVENQAQDEEDSYVPGAYFANAHKSMPTEDELEYDELTTEDALVMYKNQHVPPRYMHMIGDKNFLGNEDALTLIMDECGYYPNSVTLDGFEMIQWRKSKEEIQHILERFLCHLKEISVYFCNKCDDITGLASAVLPTCFKSAALSVVSVSFGGNFSDLVASLLALQHPEVSQLNLEKLTISNFNISTSSSCKLLTTILECHSNVRELKLDELCGELLNSSDILQCIIAIIRNPSFVKLSLKKILFSMKFAVELLTAYLMMPCSHPQELYLRNIQISGNDKGLPCSVQHAPDDATLEFKSLQWSHNIHNECYGLRVFCNWLLSFQPLHLNNLRIKVGLSSNLLPVSDMLQTIAHNPAMKVRNLTLNEWENSRLTSVEHLEAILKHPLLKSLDLGYSISSQSLACLANAFRVQHQLASLEHISISTSRVQLSSIKAFFDAIFTLPQISQLSLRFACLFSNEVVITDVIHQSWLNNGSKKLRKFQLLCTDRMWELYKHPENIQTIDTSEMQLVESSM